jgi:hypothetical protein
MKRKTTLANGHNYIIVVLEYFNKWAKAMLTSLNDGTTMTHFTFNHIFDSFGMT